jgi:hypothetical protein
MNAEFRVMFERLITSLNIFKIHNYCNDLNLKNFKKQKHAKYAEFLVWIPINKKKEKRILFIRQQLKASLK